MSKSRKNILFLTIIDIKSVNERNIYTDLIRKFISEGHNVTIVCPTERRQNLKTYFINENNVEILKIRTLNIQKTNLIEKGIGTILLEYQFLREIKKYYKSKKFDLILYSTPPITFSKVIKYIKSKDNAFAYLLLKDIFPQNAIDLNMIRTNGLLHKFFKRKESELYTISNKIGCMSQANVEYITKHNNIDSSKVEVNPNSVEIINIDNVDRTNIRLNYQIPVDKVIFVYGGNLGKPQGIDFLIEIIKSSVTLIPNAYFLIIGSGTEYNKIKSWFEEYKPKNAKLINILPKSDYDLLVQASDVGMIFLNPNFTIPNFPSRLLTYLEYQLPVFSATDQNTDIGKIIIENNFGSAVINGDLLKALECINTLTDGQDLRKYQGKLGYIYLKENFDVIHSYNKIIESSNV